MYLTIKWIFLFAACGTEEADLVFLIDGSDSISGQNFSTMKTFMKKVVDSFIIAKDKVRVGVAQYSTDPQKEFYLNEFFNSSAIKKKIDVIAQLKTRTFTGTGLKFVRSFFEPANGGRQYNGVMQYLIVITDGLSDDKVEDAAIVLRKDGIQVFVIGIGTLNSFELLQIAGSSSRVYVLENFEQLQSDMRKIVKEICNPGDKPSPGKSQHFKNSVHLHLMFSTSESLILFAKDEINSFNAFFLSNCFASIKKDIIYQKGKIGCNRVKKIEEEI